MHNGEASFVNVKLDRLTPENIAAGTYNPETDASKFSTPFESYPAVELGPHDPPSKVGPSAAKVYRSLPKKLSEFGLFQSPPAKQIPVEGVVPYDLNTPLFSDYAEKRRVLEIVFLNFVLDDVTLVPTTRKPFDMLAEGLLVSSSRPRKI